MFIITGEKIKYFNSFSVLRKNADVLILLSPSFLMSQNVLILQTLACLKFGHHLWTTPNFKFCYLYVCNLLVCTCNDVGAESRCAHDSNTGHCKCKPGVIGIECDACKDGYWGFGLDDEIGCKSKMV